MALSSSEILMLEKFPLVAKRLENTHVLNGCDPESVSDLLKFCYEHTPDVLLGEFERALDELRDVTRNIQPYMITPLVMTRDVKAEQGNKQESPQEMGGCMHVMLKKFPLVAELLRDWCIKSNLSTRRYENLVNYCIRNCPDVIMDQFEKTLESLASAKNLVRRYQEGMAEAESRVAKTQEQPPEAPCHLGGEMKVCAYSERKYCKDGMVHVRSYSGEFRTTGCMCSEWYQGGCNRC